MRVNPCATVRTRRKNQGGQPPAILPLELCEKLMVEAVRDGGAMVPWFALQLFGCLRPNEAARVTWSQLNLTDREIRLEGDQTKTGRARVLPIQRHARRMAVGVPRSLGILPAPIHPHRDGRGN